jgi:hypothetical protein
MVSKLKNSLTVRQYWQLPLNQSHGLSGGLKLHIKAEPMSYHLGYSFKDAKPTFVATISSSWQAFAPTGYFVFSGASFALFATGVGEPWPHSAPAVGFSKVTETYFEENIPDYDKW